MFALRRLPPAVGEFCRLETKLTSAQHGVAETVTMGDMLPYGFRRHFEMCAKAVDHLSAGRPGA
jgi:hypothetical protein